MANCYIILRNKILIPAVQSFIDASESIIHGQSYQGWAIILQLLMLRSMMQNIQDALWSTKNYFYSHLQ